MTKPVTIPNTFATATTAIPLSQLDSDFSTVATALNDANTYSNYAADTGVVNAYVVTLTGVSTTYSAGLRIQFKAGNANTGASTLNVNGGGTKNITFQDASALSSGTIAANAIVDVMYDGTQFLLMNDPAGTVGTGDVVGPAGATANAAAIFDSTTGKLIKDSKVIITPVANSSTLTIANNKTVTVNNTLTLSGTDSTTMTFPSTSATIARTDSAQTFTGVQTFSSNPVLDGGTANGVLYLNGSRVATSGSALTFDGTNLGVGFTANSRGGVVMTTSNNSGTSEQGGYQVTNGNGTGLFAGVNGASYSTGGIGNANNAVLYTIGNADLVFGRNTSEQMRLTSTGLGIGTSSPSQKLTVSVADAAQSTSFQAATGRIRFRPYVDATNGAIIDATNTAESAYIPLSLTGSVVRFAAGANSLLLDSSGNLGLGVTPSAWFSNRKVLQIGGSAVANVNYGAAIGENTYNVYYNSGGSSLYQNNGPAAIFDFNNVASGGFAWRLAPSGTANTTTITSGVSYTIITSGNQTSFGAANNNVGTVFAATSSGTLSSGTVTQNITFTQAMTLDASGNLLVGTTTQAASSAGRIVSAEASGGGIQIAHNNSGGGALYVALGGGGVATYTYTGAVGSESYTERARITSGGEVYIAGTTDQGAYNLQVNGTGVWGAGAYVNGSDERLKDNIQTLNDGLAVVSQLRPVTFQYKPEHSKDQSVQPGFIAQELQQAMDGKAYLDGVVQSGPEYLNVAYQNLIPILTKAIQEQQALITSLTARVALLEGTQP